MGTQSEWIMPDLQSPKAVKSPHRIPLVSPKMDVDVTGVSLKNVRTHLIDHPRDDGLKHREQLWNFQQRYRGVLGKARPAQLVTGNDDSKCESSGSDETPDEETRPNDNIRSRASTDQSLLSRFRKRLIKRKLNFTGLRSGEFVLDSSHRRSSVPSKEPKEDDKVNNPGCQRLYSSGLIVKNSLYRQLRSDFVEDKRTEQYGDNSRILETIQKYGSLDKLPDIVYPGSRTPQPHMRFIKSLSSYHRRMSDQLADRRLIPMRRTLSQISDLGTPRRKLIIVSRREGLDEEKLVRIGCIDPYNGDIDDDDNNNEETEQLLDDEDDECDNENQVSHPAKLHVRDCDKKRPDHIDIRCNITQVNTQDDMVLIEKHKQETEEIHKSELRHEFTFHGDTSSHKLNTRNEFSRTDLKRTDSTSSKVTDNNTTNKKAKQSWNNKSSSREKSRDGDETKERSNNKKCRKKKKEVDDNLDIDSESDDSLDIPDDRFGHTTHTIDKKLAIRKPWEWKPSPYRWIDKPYIRESDKPYIERIINKGEIIDEFNYDSFARTKPLKVQSFPEGAGYKDRFGNLK